MKNSQQNLAGRKPENRSEAYDQVLYILGFVAIIIVWLTA